MTLARRLEAGQLALLATAAAALGLALQLRDGSYHPSALALVGVAVLCTLAATLDLSLLALSERALIVLLAALALGQQALWLAAPVARDLPPDLSPRPLQLAIAGAALAVAAIAAGPGWLRRPAIAALLAAHLALGLWVLRHALPETDVFNFQRGGLEAFRHGVDPYAIRFRNYYDPNESFYGPGLVVRGVVQFGYPYPPLPLYLIWPAVWAGDIRYAHLGALTLSGAAIAWLRPGRVAPLAAALLLFSPRAGLLLQMAWTEPFTILFFAVTMLCALRAPRLLPIALGLFLATKQYLLFVVIAVPLLVTGPARARESARLLAQAAAVALALTLPLALWNVRAFLRSAVTLQFRQPFRDDALSVLVPLVHAGLPRLLGTILPLVLAPAAALLAAWRAPRSPAGFALAIALTYLVFLVVNKQAFCNYYFFPLAALCAAIAATPARDDAGSSPASGP